MAILLSTPKETRKNFNVRLVSNKNKTKKHDFSSHTGISIFLYRFTICKATYKSSGAAHVFYYFYFNNLLL